MLKRLNVLYQYSEGLKKSPVITKMASIGLIYAAADVICQIFVEKRRYNNFATGRTLRHTTIGTFFVAPTLHVWHSHIIPAFTSVFNTRVKKVLAAYVLGELVLAPAFLASLLFLYDFGKSKNAENAKRNVKEKLGTTLKEYYKRWTLVSLFTYSVVPIPFRPIFTSLYGISWQVYLSHMTNARVASPPTPIHSTKAR